MNRGFTFIELLVIIAVSLVLFSFSYAIYSNFQKTQTIDAVRQEVVEAIRLTQQKAKAGMNNNSHGIYFAGSSYVMFGGNTYASRIPAQDVSFDLPSGYTFTGLLEVTFSMKTGLPSVTGTITISNTSMATTTSIIINGYGLIY